MLTALLAVAAIWLATAIPAAVLLGRAIASADRQQATQRQQAPTLRSVA